MKQYLLHTVSCIILVLTVFNGVWWLAVPLSFWYVLRYPAYELVAVGFCIDVYFAPTMYTFNYSYVACALVLFGIFIRPRVRREHSFMSLGS